MTFRLVFSGLVGLLLTTACDSSTDPAPRDVTEVEFHASLGVELDEMTRSPSGLYHQTLEEGTGVEVAAPGDSVEVHYRGFLPNATLFDFTDVIPLAFRLGTGIVIDGFDEGIRGMRVDETRLIVIPHELGYGGRRRGSIPPFSALVFNLTLVSIYRGPP